MRLAKLFSRRWLVAVGLTAAFAAVSVVAVLAIWRPQPGIPQRMVRQAGFPLYFPKPIPKAVSLDRDSFSLSDRALVYSFSYEGSKHVVVTVQPRPKDFDAGLFRASKEVTTPIGRAYVVDLPERTTAAVINDRSLVFVNAPDGMPMSGFEDVLGSLHPVK